MNLNKPFCFLIVDLLQKDIPSSSNKDQATD